MTAGNKLERLAQILGVEPETGGFPIVVTEMELRC